MSANRATALAELEHGRRVIAPILDRLRKQSDKAIAAAARRVLLDLARSDAPERLHTPRTPIVSWQGHRVHVVTLRDGNTAHTRCGLTIEDADDLIRAARLLDNPKPCRRCSPSEAR